MKRQPLHQLHTIAGLISGLFILLMSVSGAILVFHADIDVFQQPTVGYSNGNKTTLSVDSCYKFLQHQYPRAQISQAVLPSNSHPCYRFSIYDSSFKNGMEAEQLFLHPQTGQILLTSGNKELAHNFSAWLSGFHNSLLLGKTGEWLLGCFSLIFLISLLSGLVLFRKDLLAVLLFRRSVFRKNNLHQVIGCYALLFNIMIAFTGFWMQRYVFKKEFYSPSQYSRTVKASAPLSFSIAAANQQIQKQIPGFTSHVIYFPATKSGSTVVYGSRLTNSFIHSKDLADVIYLDSLGNIAKTAFVTDIDASDRFDIINAQVHFGNYGGMAVKIIYFLLGLTSGLLSITGFILWFKRRNSASLR